MITVTSLPFSIEASTTGMSEGSPIGLRVLSKMRIVVMSSFSIVLPLKQQAANSAE